MRRARRCDVVRMDEDNSQLPPVLRGYCKLVEIVFGVVAKDVDGLIKVTCCRQQDREVSHDGLERRLDLGRPLRGRAPLERFVKRSFAEVLLPWRVVAEFVPGRHVAHARGLVERERAQLAAVERGAPRPAALCRPPVAIFHLA